MRPHFGGMRRVSVLSSITSISLKAPFKDVFGGIPPLDSVTSEQQKYISLYREALNSSSANYSYLCFYRIIEGLRDRCEQIRKAAVDQVLAKGERPVGKPDERIPSAKEEQIVWLNALYGAAQEWDDFALALIFIPDVVNKRVRHLIDKGASTFIN